MTSTLRPFREIAAKDLASVDLKSELDEHGYVVIRNLLTTHDLRPLLSDVTGILREADWLSPHTDPLDRIADPASACAEDDPDPRFKSVHNQVFSLPSFHALPHHAALQKVMKRLVGPELLILPKSAVRLIFPNYERSIIHAHQDYNPATAHTETFTAWMPLHDCPLDQGPLRILEGSHRFGVQPTPGQTGFIPAGSERGDAWATGAIQAGDVLLFNNLIVHEAAPNTSNRLRLSVDCRFQSYRHPVDPAVLVFTGSGSRSWETTYAHWPSASGNLKFYWTRLPLCLKPSTTELAKLAQASESPKLRARYARILDRITSQLSLPSV